MNYVVLKIWILECNRSMSGQKYSFKGKSFQLLLFYYFFNVARIKLKRESCVSCALAQILEYISTMKKFVAAKLSTDMPSYAAHISLLLFFFILKIPTWCSSTRNIKLNNSNPMFLFRTLWTFDRNEKQRKICDFELYFQIVVLCKRK